MCVYNKISDALKNITDTSVYISNQQKILKAGRRLLCQLKFVIIQTENNPGRFISQLSSKICEISVGSPLVTPGPNQVLSSLYSIQTAKYVVFKANETLVKDVLGRLFEFGYNHNRRRRNKNAKRRRKCRKGKGRGKLGNKKQCNKKNKRRRNNRKSKNKSRKNFVKRRNRQYKNLSKF